MPDKLLSKYPLFHILPILQQTSLRCVGITWAAPGFQSTPETVAYKGFPAYRSAEPKQRRDPWYP